jgi:glutaredoxin
MNAKPIICTSLFLFAVGLCLIDEPRSDCQPVALDQPKIPPLPTVAPTHSQAEPKVRSATTGTADKTPSAAKAAVVAQDAPTGPRKAPSYDWAECPAYARLVGEKGDGVVLLSATWCPSCQQEARELKAAGIAFIEVDYDRHRKTAELLADRNTIPQTIVVRKGNIEWRGGYATAAKIKSVQEDCRAGL